METRILDGHTEKKRTGSCTHYNMANYNKGVDYNLDIHHVAAEDAANEHQHHAVAADHQGHAELK